MVRLNKHAARRWLKIIYVLIVVCVGVWQLDQSTPANSSSEHLPDPGSSVAAEALKTLAVKGRAPKTGYSRDHFYISWGTVGLCDMRNYILARDMTNVHYVPDTCKVASGQLHDPYTNTDILFVRGVETSDDVQIDHVVSLSDAWQKGAQQLLPLQRYALANDPLNLLAVDGQANQNKGDVDAATWLPPNTPYRCAYVARQIAVKKKYQLWVTPAEYNAIAKLLIECPAQTLPSP